MPIYQIGSGGSEPEGLGVRAKYRHKSEETHSWDEWGWEILCKIWRGLTLWSSDSSPQNQALVLIYHVLSRGDRREAIVSDDTDRELYLDLLGRTCRRTAWQIHAFCVMSNHFHLVVETPRSNLSAGMQWFLGSYTQQFNRRHRLSGHLFGGRYKALLVDGREQWYLRRHVRLRPSQSVAQECQRDQAPPSAIRDGAIPLSQSTKETSRLVAHRSVIG